MLPVTYESIYSHDNLFAVKTESVLKMIGFEICKNSQRKVFFHLLTLPGRVMFVNLMNYYHKFLGKEFGTNKYMKCKEEVVPNIVSVVYDLVALRKCQQKNLAKSVPDRKIKQEEINLFFFNVYSRKLDCQNLPTLDHYRSNYEKYSWRIFTIIFNIRH